MAKAVLILPVEGQGDPYVILGEEAMVNIDDNCEVTTDHLFFNRDNIFYKETPNSPMEHLTDQVRYLTNITQVLELHVIVMYVQYYTTLDV